MNFSNAVSGATAVAGAVGVTAVPTNQFTTTIAQCDGVAPEHYALAFLCTPCAAAIAKGKADQSSPVYNVFCWTPIASYSFVRVAYNIVGECGVDLMNGALCMPCGARQIYTEASQLGAIPGGNYGQATASWTTDLFQCSASECLIAAFCPCTVSAKTRVLLQPSSANEHWFNLLCVVPMAMYGQTRHTVGIGSEWPHPVLEDLAVGLIFYPCALNRAFREATAYRAKAAGGAVLNKAVAGVANALGNLRAKLPGVR